MKNKKGVKSETWLKQKKPPNRIDKAYIIGMRIQRRHGCSQTKQATEPLIIL